MKQIKIVKDKIVHEFTINKRKTIAGDMKLDVFNILKECANKVTLSEYSKLNQNSSNIYIDGKLIDSKNYQILELSRNLFDLVNEYKLTQKSLFTLSLESILSNSDIIDQINTINILLNDLSVEIENIYNVNNIELIVDNLEINKKNILKLIDISLMKEELKTNQYDYNINELNEIKLSLFKMIVLNNKQISFIILNDHEYSNTNDLMDLDNVYIITTEKSNNIYDSNNKIDFDNEELLYEKYFNSFSNLSYENYVSDLLGRIIS